MSKNILKHLAVVIVGAFSGTSLAAAMLGTAGLLHWIFLTIMVVLGLCAYVRRVWA